MISYLKKQQHRHLNLFKEMYLRKLSYPNHQHYTVPEENVGAISEMKHVSNRVSYRKVSRKYVTDKTVDIPEDQNTITTFIDMFIITLNNNSYIGLIYEKACKTTYVLFQKKMFAFYNCIVVQQRPYKQNVDLADKDKLSTLTHEITSAAAHIEPKIKYEDANCR